MGIITPILCMENEMTDPQVKHLFSSIKSDVINYFSGINSISYTYKSGRELVTRADTELNEIITGHIKQHFPDHNIISEEGNNNISPSEYCWHIDPIDNSVGFIAGESEISVSIALKHCDDYVYSMVLNPRTSEVFEAYDGESILNGSRIETFKGSLSELTRGVSTCAYVTKTRIEIAKNVLGKMFEARLPLRVSGGSALDLCRVAEGKSYAHVCLGAHNWDVEAGIHILKNAGGEVDIIEVFPERMALAFIGASCRKVLDELRLKLGL